MTGVWKGSTSHDVNQTTMSTYLKHQSPSAGYHCNFSPLLLVIWNPANRSCCQWGVRLKCYIPVGSLLQHQSSSTLRCCNYIGHQATLPLFHAATHVTGKWVEGLSRHVHSWQGRPRPAHLTCKYHSYRSTVSSAFAIICSSIRNGARRSRWPLFPCQGAAEIFKQFTEGA